MPLRNGQTDEYHLYVYAKLDNDYRPPEDPTTSHNLWSQVDLGLLDIVHYNQILDAIKATFQTNGIDDKYIICPEKVLYEDKHYAYLVKYGDEIPVDFHDQLGPLDIPNPSAIVENASQLALVVWAHVTAAEPAPIIIYPSDQVGATVPMMTGGRRRLRSTRRGRRSSRRSAKRRGTRRGRGRRTSA